MAHPRSMPPFRFLHPARRPSLAPLVALLLLLAPISGAGRDSAAPQRLEATVVSVGDGDSITMRDLDGQRRRVRLFAVDAPELEQPNGRASRKQLARFLRGASGTVVVEWRKKDRYGRLVGKVFVNGVDAGLAQIEAGMAWHFQEFAGEQTEEDRSRYERAHRKARQERRGLWADPAPTPPWTWRRANPNRRD